MYTTMSYDFMKMANCDDASMKKHVSVMEMIETMISPTESGSYNEITSIIGTTRYATHYIPQKKVKKEKYKRSISRISE